MMNYTFSNLKMKTTRRNRGWRQQHFAFDRLYCNDDSMDDHGPLIYVPSVDTFSFHGPFWDPGIEANASRWLQWWLTVDELMKAQILEELKSLRAFSECRRQALAETDLKIDQILVCIPPLSISVEVQCAVDDRHPDRDKWKMEVPQDSISVMPKCFWKCVPIFFGELVCARKFWWTKTVKSNFGDFLLPDFSDVLIVTRDQSVLICWHITAYIDAIGLGRYNNCMPYAL